MLFNSVHFLFFFPVVMAGFIFLPNSLRWLFLLLASCYFYMAFIPVYILILFVLIGIDFTAAKHIEESEGLQRKVFFGVSLAATCLMLFIFKYYNFFISNFDSLSRSLGLNFSIQTMEVVLPIGLSFHTFQSLSYVIEVYKGRFKAERHLGKYALYVMFFPQLVAGPIERPYNLLKQLWGKPNFTLENWRIGLKVMAIGFIKKVLLADNLSILVDEVYGAPGEYQGAAVLLATVCFAFQIYYDFSGYSEIAIGAAKIMGIDLMQNFRTPYFAASIREFWTRWHISLSTWFRDYVYIPLGGSRVGPLRWMANIAAVFMISGLWHGANWTFVVWGALHGLYYISEKKFLAGVDGLAEGKGLAAALVRTARVLITFGLVCLAWVFFRAVSVSDACDALGRIFYSWRAGAPCPASGGDAAVFLLMAVAFEVWCLLSPRLEAAYAGRMWWRGVVLGARIAAVLAFLSLGNFGARQFIYFQF